MSRTIAVGVDGGGSGSRARIVGPDGGTLAEVEGEPAAVDPGAPDAAALRVEDLVRRALRSAAKGPPAAALCAALAGAGRPEPRRAVRSALVRAGIAREVVVETDARAAHRDAFGAGGAGVLLAAGTGSVALARGPGGAARAGGWGPRLGDEGSGYDLARRALRAVARAADGRAPFTTLTGLLLDRAGLDSPAELVAWSDAAGRDDLARLAPPVVEAAGADPPDPTAERLVAEAAASLCTAVRAARRRCRPDPPSRVALSGGLLGREGPLRPRVADRLRGLGLEVAPGEASVLDGACRRARDLAGS